MTIDEALERFLSERGEAARRLAAQAMKQFASWYPGTTGEPLSLINWTPQDTNHWLSYLLTTKHRTPNTGVHPSDRTMRQRQLSRKCAVH